MFSPVASVRMGVIRCSPFVEVGRESSAASSAVASRQVLTPSLYSMTKSPPVATGSESEPAKCMCESKEATADFGDAALTFEKAGSAEKLMNAVNEKTKIFVAIFLGERS